MIDIIWLGLQAAMAIITIELFRRAILPGARTMAQPQLVLDVWAPLAVIAPGLFQLGRVNANVAEGAGWLALGAPSAAAVLGLAASLIVISRQPAAQRQQQSLVRPLHLAAWTVTGVMLLMLATAHQLSLWVGQCAFAAGAVLLWMNTPELPRGERPKLDAREAHTGATMTLAMFTALGHGAAAVMVSNQMQPLSVAITVVSMAMILAAAAVIGAGDAAVRMGGWAATYAALFGLGVISLLQMLPQVTSIVRDGQVTAPIRNVAYGFGALTIEATLLAALGPAAVLALRLNRSGRAVFGVLLLLGVSALAAWRIDAM